MNIVDYIALLKVCGDGTVSDPPRVPEYLWTEMRIIGDLSQLTDEDRRKLDTWNLEQEYVWQKLRERKGQP